MSEFDALVKGVIADPGGAGALADWLQENGREKEAVLLRRRWRRWQGEVRRAHDPAEGFENAAASERQFTNAFRAYLRERFAGRRIECVRVWLSRRDRALPAHIPRASPLPTPGQYETLCGWNLSTFHYAFTSAPTKIAGACGRCRDRLSQTDTPLLDEVPK